MLPSKLASPNRTLLTRLAGLRHAGRGGGLLHPVPRPDRREAQEWLQQQHDWCGVAPETAALRQARAELPISAYRKQILDALDSSPVLVLQGETGCGKTTQVPQFILDEMIRQGKAADANIICTQPRRLSAVGVARRVSDERGEESVGGTIGYAVRGEIWRSEHTRMLFCTTGVLLRHVASTPDLRGISHVIVDEVHERGMLTDFLLILLRELARRAEAGADAPKIVLMSATLDAERFANYFGGCPVLTVPGRVHPVRELYLEDIVEKTGYQGSEDRRGQAWEAADLSPNIPSEVLDACTRIGMHEIDYDLIEETILYLHETEGPGAFLVFLTGHSEIENMLSRLQESKDFSDFHLVALHGQQSPEQQCKVFEPPPAGMRKVVVATNVAETSITVNDVVAVVDCGKVKERRWSARNSLATLREVRISEANALQRQGRAGRVRPGVVVKLWGSAHKLQRHQEPEMLRSPLEDLVLQSCLLGVERPIDFLQEAMQPPPDSATRQALQSLEILGALIRSPDGSVVLTPLGAQLATIPVDPRLGKMLLLSCFLGIPETMLTVAARMGSRPAFYVPRNRQREVSYIHKMRFGDDRSDQLAVARAFRMWAEVVGTSEEKPFLEKHCVAPSAMRELFMLRRQLADHLVSAGWLPEDHCGSYDLADDEKELARGIIAAGLWPNVARGQRAYSTRKMYERITVGDDQEEVWMHPASVNANVAGTACEECVYVYSEKVETSRVFLRESTRVSATALLLFGPQELPAVSAVAEHGFVTLARQRIVISDYKSLHGLKEKLDTALMVRCMRPSAPARHSVKAEIVDVLRDPSSCARLLSSVY
eukprot:TRINITY_DN32142_c0_g1_i1.p1 TRINITY_DN32142_c0_g1~~TRINITY_DN32142_c0_g1_i1.p1  ORF type:complete len:829 (+),score=206.63 TRINITY_DN32142_c0_g1_i1:87-2573(+)